MLEDTPVHAARRWVRIVPRGSQGACLLLARAVNDEQASRIGKQAGDGFPSSAIPMISSATVRACRRKACISVRHEDYGTAVVFEDLYGNLRDLIEPKTWART